MRLTRQWAVVGAAAALGVGTAVATAAVSGFVLNDQASAEELGGPISLDPASLPQTSSDPAGRQSASAASAPAAPAPAAPAPAEVAPAPAQPANSPAPAPAPVDGSANSADSAGSADG